MVKSALREGRWRKKPSAKEMIRSITKLIKMLRRIPEVKVGDIYWADAWEFVGGKPIEHVLHGLRYKNGEVAFDPIYGDSSYRMKINSVQPSYYVIQCEVLAADVHERSEKHWFFRCQPRRINRQIFHDMIRDRRVKKETYESDIGR